MSSTAILVTALLCVVVLGNLYLFRRAAKKEGWLRIQLFTKLSWSLLGAIVLLWLILSGRLEL
ncbi:MAG: hypothetical protein KF797_15335 [Flavobacteriales bacterium]|nr:hypothetical protein [Flavobacteriales bacterium]